MQFNKTSLNNKQASEKIEVLDYVKVPLALMVLFIHVDLIRNTNPDVFNIDKYPIAYNLSYFVSYFISSISVPAFFFISGFLFFRSWKFSWTSWGGVKIRNRIRSLFIPYVVWNTIFIVVLFFLQRLLPSGSLSTKLISDYNWMDFLMSYVSMDYVVSGFSFRPFMIGPIDLPLWYLRDLIILSILTPAIYAILRRTRFLMPLLLSVLWITNLCPFAGPIGMLGLVFFCTGAYFGIFQINFMVIFARYIRLLLIMFLVICIIMMIYKFESPTSITRLSIICGVPIMFNAASYLQVKGFRMPYILKASTFFVYASHYYISVVAIRVLSSVCMEHEILLCIVYLVMPVILLFILGFLDHFIRKYFNPTLACALLGSLRTNK